MALPPSPAGWDRIGTLDAFRAALTRLFERFVLETHPVILRPGEELHSHWTLGVPDGALGRTPRSRHGWRRLGTPRA
jgi:hypothetical protein